MWRKNVDGRKCVLLPPQTWCSQYQLPPEQWARASTDFFESFRNYDESGSPQRIQVLKYLVLANMLMGSDINPFDSQETNPSVFFFFITCCRFLFYLMLKNTKTTLKLPP